MPISVIPYLSSKVCPVMLFHFSRTGTGRAAEPDTINLHRERPGKRYLRAPLLQGICSLTQGHKQLCVKPAAPKSF